MIELRDYQQECVSIVNSLPDNSRTVVALATGLGKTLTASRFQFNRMLWLSHRDELVRQPERYFVEQGYSYGVEKAGEHENGEDIVSASIQSISRDVRLKKFDPEAFDVIVCDEAHHAAAPTYKKVLSYFRPKRLIGLTATPQRGDKVRLDDVFDDICFARDLRWGIENGYLSRIRCLHVQASFDMFRVEKQAGDFTAGSLERELLDSDDDMVVTKAYLDHCLSQKRKTIIYCPTIKVCQVVMGTLINALPEEEKNTVKLLTQNCSAEERHEILDGYKEGRYHCLINCMILTEGTDLPDTEAIIINRPSANASLYQQIVGRGTRLSEGKEYCLIIDIVGENYVKKSVCTAPTLFGINPDELPPSFVNKIEGEDLLEATNALLEDRAKTAKQLELSIELVDIFTQKKIDIIQGGLSQTDINNKAAVIADKYREVLEAEDEGYDFGDLIVKKEPSDARYYRIQPTFDGVIYISKPDMLGHVVIDASIPECDVDFISDPMPMDEAVDFIHQILQFIVPYYYAQKWSKTARKELEKVEATDSQRGRVWHDFSNYGNQVSSDHLTKLQASDLIDLMLDIKKLEKEKKDLIALNSPPKMGTKKYEKWLKNKESAERTEALKRDARKAVWKNCRVLLQSRIESGKRRQKQIEAEREAEQAMVNELKGGKTKTFPLPMKYDYFRKDPDPSTKQMAFLTSLINQAKQRNFVFDESPFSFKLDMWHTGFLINYLLHVKDRLPSVRGYWTVCHVSEFINDVSGITGPAGNPVFIQCSYHLEKMP